MPDIIKADWWDKQ